MSTHNIGFYEDLTKIIFELSSNTHLISSADTSCFLPQNNAHKVSTVWNGTSNQTICNKQNKIKIIVNFKNLIMSF